MLFGFSIGGPNDEQLYPFAESVKTDLALQPCLVAHVKFLVCLVCSSNRIETQTTDIFTSNLGFAAS